MNLYIEIPKQFAEELDGVQSTITNDAFASAVTVDGRYVTALQAFVNYPVQFMELKTTGWTFDPIELDMKDFPIPELPNEEKQ